MVALIFGSLLLSLLHAIIPNHWLPILAIGKKEKWQLNEVLSITAVAGLSHVLSTLLIGWSLVFFGKEFLKFFSAFTPFIAPSVLIIIGIIFIYRHHRHKHFHIADQQHQSSKAKMILTLSLAMFFSPCLEIEAFFLAASSQNVWWTVLMSAIYAVVTLSGMMVWVGVAYRGLNKFNWHALEHKAGIITGTTLILTGVATYFIH
ncbi:MAG: manganese efflux pump [Bacteroidetes bacterium]|nr:manganese efflux pump [Bacteroidota bacterium]